MMVKNNSEQLFGIVREGKSKTDYSGIESETALVTVNHKEKTIKADVIVKNILGEESDKAYPGHLGAAAYATAHITKDKVDLLELNAVTKTDLENLIQNLKFIDGGSAPIS